MNWEMVHGLLGNRTSYYPFDRPEFRIQMPHQIREADAQQTAENPEQVDFE